MSDQPLMTFKSHIEGNNPDVNIYTDRVEQGQKSRMSRTSSGEVIPAGSHRGAQSPTTHA
jgi:hypothetical protein